MPSGWRGPSKPRPRGAGRVRLGPSCALGPGAFVLARDRGPANFPIISSEHEHPHLQLAPRLHESLHPPLPLPSTALFLPLLTAKLLERANLLPVFLECSRAPQAFHPTPQLQGEGSPCTPRREAQRSDVAPSGGSALGRGPSGAACTLREGHPDCRRCPSFPRIALESSRAAGRHSDPVGRRQACHKRGLGSPSPRARARRAP